MISSEITFSLLQPVCPPLTLGGPASVETLNDDILVTGLCPAAAEEISFRWLAGTKPVAPEDAETFHQSCY